MRDSTPDEFRSLLRSALDALKRGDKNAARSLAEQAASLAPGAEEPLLVLATLTSPQLSLAYIKQALRINPESRVARQALEWARKRQRGQSTEPEEDLFEIGPLLSARLAVLAESVLEPDPLPTPIHLSTSPSVPAEMLPEPEPLSAPIPPPASLAVPSRKTPLTLPSSKTTSPAASAVIPGDQPRAELPLSSPAELKKPGLSRVALLLGSALVVGALICFGLLAFWFGRPLLAGLSQATQPIQPAASSPVAESNLPPSLEGTPATLDPNPEIMGTPGETIPTPSGDVQAEISLLETSASPEGSIRVSISILNYGPESFTLRTEDVALISPDGALLALDKSTPRLPEKLSSGETQSFTFTFPRPATPIATLRIFSVEYDIKGY